METWAVDRIRTCLGMPLAAVAPLTPLEADAVEKRFGFLRARMMFGMLILIASLGGGLGAATWGRNAGDGALEAIFGAALYLGILIGLAASFLILKDVTGEAVRLAQDRRRAQVLVFRGEGAGIAVTRQGALAFLRHGEVPAGGAPTELRVLPSASLLLRPGPDRLEFVPVRIH